MSTLRIVFMVCLICGGMAERARDVGAAASTSQLVFCCQEGNDLYRVVLAGGQKLPRFDTPAAAVEAASDGAGVLILADGYPETTTMVPPAVFDLADKKRVKMYVEYPAALPGLEVGPPKAAKLERGVVASDFFGPGLPALRILMVNGCRYVPVRAEKPHLVLAKVAGVDTAVFGLQGTTSEPLLFDRSHGGLLVATTKLSNFVTGRYMPQEAWRVVWQGILKRLQPEATPTLVWTATVRPTFTCDEPLPADVEAQALRRSADWIVHSRILRHADWPEESLRWALRYNTVRDMPKADWPLGDGSLGILEGYSSTIRADGSQPMRYAVRNDCTSEVAMLLALAGQSSGRSEHGRTAQRMLDYLLSRSGLASGDRANPAKPEYGLVGWSLDGPRAYWGDDNARAILGVLAAAAVEKEHRWDDVMARCILANFRTTGSSGFRHECVQGVALDKGGWQPFWKGRHLHYSPHMQAWLWACYFWAYDKTRFEPLLARGETGVRRLMEAYPTRWQWVNRSGSIERARGPAPLGLAGSRERYTRASPVAANHGRRLDCPAGRLGRHPRDARRRRARHRFERGVRHA